MTSSKGFTLIELSIVLVIIGLIVGGILVGQDLIKAAETRAQISQIEKFNSAVNTFRGKFGGIPGDLGLSQANQYGFVVTNCTGSAGRRDGNGLIDGYSAANTFNQFAGETGLFWQDLSSYAAGNLIDGSFPNGGASVITCNSPAIAATTTPGSSFLGNWLPQAKIGHGNFIYVTQWSGNNWYGLVQLTGSDAGGALTAASSIPVMQAYNMDKKTDDGLPRTGTVQTAYAYSFNSIGSPASGLNDTTATCYNTTNNAYSISSYANYGSNGNCALSFRFQ